MRQRIDMNAAPQINVFELPPIWGTRKTVIRWFGISERRLDELADRRSCALLQGLGNE